MYRDLGVFVRRSLSIAFSFSVVIGGMSQAQAAGSCPAARDAPLFKESDRPFCESLAGAIRKPSALPLNQYEEKLQQYLGKYCHRDAKAGWKVDKRVRDTGPYIIKQLDDWSTGQDYGTHAPVVIRYSQEMYDWLKKARPNDGAKPIDLPLPEGAVMIKEMYPAPAAACEGVELDRLFPTSGAAVMVRDGKASADGWFWGWFGWEGWKPDWPASAGNALPNMGFGQYCTNCHASAIDQTQTFASLDNIAGESGRPLTYLIQDYGLNSSLARNAQTNHHQSVTDTSDDAKTLGQAGLPGYNPAFTALFELPGQVKPTADTVVEMPSTTYDNVWVAAHGKNGAEVGSQFLTSDQCIGCHDAGGTGLQFDMTSPDGPDGKLLNHSPYSTWRTSPMGMGGRDPIFFAQLASETETFHPEPGVREEVQDICLGCHGIQGQRQSKIDRGAAGDACAPFLREDVNAVPYPADNPMVDEANYGALARDGISCTACHHMVLGDADTKLYKDQPQNRCVAERQELLNPGEEGFAKTFTGSFLVGAPNQLFGPFKGPKQKPMQNALGITPEHNGVVMQSELCGSCHTVHLPVLYKGESLKSVENDPYRIYEQTTYPEWAFSAYRTGETTDGPLPHGKGELAESCQGCHMPSKDADGKPTRSKIASIQEFSNFPETDHNLGPNEIDLPVREGFAKHTLVGLNLFFVKMAQQFPNVLGMRTQSPMLTSKGLDPLLYTERAMLEQARNGTAGISVDPIKINGKWLEANVTLRNKTGHKFPSGVGFRRAFVQFELLDAEGKVLWASGRTDKAGVITDEEGEPLKGELWWKSDCSARIDPLKRTHQPHYQTITRQDQVQIYQELVSTPTSRSTAQCGHGKTPAGELTTSFLSICTDVKDNRLLPQGFLPLEDRKEIARALGAKGDELAVAVGPTAVDGDPDYVTGGKDSLEYRIDLTNLGQPAAVRASLYYQATPPFYLQDRFCTAKSDDTKRLYYLAGHLNLEGSAAQDWKLEVVSTGAVPIP